MSQRGSTWGQLETNMNIKIIEKPLIFLGFFDSLRKSLEVVGNALGEPLGTPWGAPGYAWEGLGGVLGGLGGAWGGLGAALGGRGDALGSYGEPWEGRGDASGALLGRALEKSMKNHLERPPRIHVRRESS